MNKKTIVQQLVPRHTSPKAIGQAYAASNIALAKYWGKRNHALNLPMNSSLSISLADKGAKATVEAIEQPTHELIINQQKISNTTSHSQQLIDYLNLFSTTAYRVTLDVNIPFAAGLASSACVFAAIILALNDLHSWQLEKKALSILARLGSGSAARSIEPGFIEWSCGHQENGMDSYATLIPHIWQELRIGLCIVSNEKKTISSRTGMRQTVAHSPLYPCWPDYANKCVTDLKVSIAEKNFSQLGSLTEQCAQSMHATMISAFPAINYSITKTFELKQRVWQLRAQGTEIYFTQDAGPNLKLLFLHKDTDKVMRHFNNICIIKPFKDENYE